MFGMRLDLTGPTWLFNFPPPPLTPFVDVTYTSMHIKYIMIYHVFTSTHRRYTKCAGWMTRVRIKLFRFPLILFVYVASSAVMLLLMTKMTIKVQCVVQNVPKIFCLVCFQLLFPPPKSFTFLMPSCILADAFHYGDDGQAFFYSYYYYYYVIASWKERQLLD